MIPFRCKARSVTTRVLAGVLGGLTLLGGVAAAQDQMGDPDFTPTVPSPAYPDGGPTVVLDEAHGSDQTIDGRYRAFAAVLGADGYDVVRGTTRFDEGGLDQVNVLVIANAAALPPEEGGPSAFTESEIDALDAWVRAGGALLLAADHAPHGDAAAPLAARFGVGMGKGYAFRLTETGLTTTLDYDLDPDRPDAHPILRGRSVAERVRRVRAFTGQSLSPPLDAEVLLPMADGRWEGADRDVLGVIRERMAADDDVAAVLSDLAVPIVDGAQGLALQHGDGRVVVLGEAGMLTAQLIRFPPEDQREDIRFGLTTPGHDNQQFLLNILHWLSGDLD